METITIDVRAKRTCKFKGKRKNASSLKLAVNEISSGLIAKELDLPASVVSDSLRSENAPLAIRKQGAIKIYEKDKFIQWLEAHSKEIVGQRKFLYVLANEVRRKYVKTFKDKQKEEKVNG